MWMDADEKSPFAAVDIDQGKVKYGFLHVNRHFLACSKGRCTSDQVARVAVRNFGFARLNTFAIGLPCQFLGGNLAIAMHQDEEGVCILVFHHERLDHCMFINIQFARRNFGAAVFFIFVWVAGKRDAMLAQETGCRRFRVVFVGFCHDVDKELDVGGWMNTASVA